MENILTSKPLYERIIIDRHSSQIVGITFEDVNDKEYFETYSYAMDPENASQTIYKAHLYKDPGLKKYIRYKCH